MPLSRTGGRAQRTDAELLGLIAKGDLSALGEVYDRYQADVRRVLARVTPGASDVDDAIQVTFLELPRIAASFDGRESARAWIVGVAVRLASRRRRGFARLLRALGAYAQTASHATSVDPETTASDREQLRALDRALARMSAKKRDAFVLVELEGIVIDEAADALGVPAATVGTRLFHARAELRAAMKKVRP